MAFVVDLPPASMLGGMNDKLVTQFKQYRPTDGKSQDTIAATRIAPNNKNIRSKMHPVPNLEATYGPTLSAINPNTVAVGYPRNPYPMPYNAMPTFQPLKPVRYPDITTAPGSLPENFVSKEERKAVEKYVATDMPQAGLNAVAPNVADRNNLAIVKQAIVQWDEGGDY